MSKTFHFYWYTDMPKETQCFPDEASPAQEDIVNHPKHYGQGVYEVIKVIEAWGFDKDFYLGNVIKYISRAGLKNPKTEIEDLEKAIWYLKKKITMLQNLD